MATPIELPKPNIPIEGNALTPNGTSIPGVGATPVLPTMDIMKQEGISEAGLRRFDIGSYENILGVGKVNPNLDLSVLNENRAQNQTGWQLTSKSLGQLGTTVLGGTITGIGSMLNFLPTTYRAISQIWDENAKYKWDDAINNGLGSEFQKIGKDIEQWGRSTMPIYQTNKAQKGGIAGGLSDATWWASMFPTVGSAAASMLPVLGQMKALQIAGKFIQGFSTIGKLGTGLNKAGQLLQNPYTQQVIGTLYGAHLDSMEEIVRGYDEQYAYALNLGYSDQDARKFASVYASESYNDAWAYGVLFNAIELNSMLRGINNSPVNNIKIEQGLKRNIKGLASKGKLYQLDDISQDLNRKLLTRVGLRKTKDFFSVALSEGAEEMRVDMALNEGIVAAKKELGIDDETSNLTPLARMGRMIKQSQSWDSFIWGAIGGGVMTGGRGGINKLLNGKSQQEYETKRATNIINGIQDTASIISDFDGDMNIKVTEEPDIDSNGNQKLNEDGTPKLKRTITDPASDILIGIMSTMGNTNGFQYGIEYFNEVLKLNDNQLEEIYGNNKKPIIESLRREFMIAKNIQSKNAGLTWGNPFDNILRTQASTDEYLLDYYKRQLNIIDTELKTFDLDLTNLRNENEEKLKSINNKLYTLNISKTVYEQERDNINNIISDYKIKVNDQERKKIISVTKSKLTKLNNKIKEVQSQIDIINSEIVDLNKYINNQAAISLKQSNRKARESYKFNIKDTKKQILEKQSKIANAKELINEYNINKLNYEQSISIHQGEISDAQKHIDIFTNELDDYNRELERINSEIIEESTKENNNSVEYNQARRQLKNTKNNNNRIYQSLEEAFTTVSMAVSALEHNVNNREILMKERAVLLKEVYDKQDEIDKAKEDNKIINDEIKKESTKESEKIIVESLTDSNGITYSIDDIDAPNSVLFNKEVYSIGSKFNIAESPKIIENLKVDYDAELDYSILMITIKDDISGISETISAKELLNRGITKYTSKLENESEKTFNTLYKIQDSLSADQFRDKYFDVIEHLYTELTNNKSDIYKALLLPLDNSEINNFRAKLIGNFIGWLDQYKPEEISNTNIEKSNSIKTLLLDSNIRIKNNIKLNDIQNYVINLYGNDLISHTPEENSNMRKALQGYFSNISRIIDNNFELIDNELKYNDLGNDLIVIRDQIEDLTKILAENLGDRFDSVIFEDFYKKIVLFKNTLIKELGNITTKFYKKRIDYLSSVANRFLNKIRNIRQDEKSPLHNTLVDEDKFGNQTSDIIEFTTTINNLVDDFIKHGVIINLPTRTRLYKLYQGVDKYIVDNIDELSLPNANINQDVRNSNVLDLLRASRAIYENLAKYYNFETGIEVSDDVRMLNSIDLLAESVKDFIDDEYIRDEYATNDYRYYISDSMRNALDAIEKTIVQLDLRNIYNNKHIYSFEDILDALYQEQNGREQVLKYYDSIWFALKYFKNDRNTDDIKHQMKINGVPKEHLESLNSLLDVVKNRIHNPLITVENVYIDSSQNIKPKYINDFFKTHTQNEFEQSGHKGLRRLTPEIYTILSNPNNYDSRNRRLKSKIDINGTNFTPNEIFNALRTLKEGQEFIVKYNNGNIDINIDINGKSLLIERIGLGDSEYYHNIKLGRISEDNSIQYDSAFGTESSTSKYIDTIIKKTSNSNEIFNYLKDYYKIYTEALNKEKQNNPEIKSVLISILKDLSKYGQGKKEENSDIINALFGATQYNTELEGLTPNSLPVEDLDLNKVYYIISPIFYNVRLNNINDYIRYGLRIKSAYKNLNAKLANDFIQSQQLLNEIKEKGVSTLVLTGINKSPITFAEDTSYRANVNEEIQKTVIINSKPAVNIIHKQPDSKNITVYSSLTLNDTFGNIEATNKIFSPDRSYQMYAEIKANDSKNGTSYIPLHRGNLKNDIAEDSFGTAALAYVTSTMSNILSDATLTFMSNTSKSGIYKMLDDSKGTLTAKHNLDVRNVYEKLSEAIIVYENTNSVSTEWFNISALYETTNSTTGKIEYTKNVDFKTVVRKKNKIGNGISYMNRIKVKYDKINNEFIPIEIVVSRNTDPINRKYQNGKRKLGISKSPFTEKQINSIGGTIEKSKKSNGTYAVINLKSKSTNNKQINDILNSELFQNLYANMQRSVNTAYTGNNYTYGIKENGEYKPILGEYKSNILEWAKQNRIIAKSTKTTFDSMQDFILDTGALTTSVVGIKDSNGDIITNYTIDAVKPAMYFEMKSKQSDPIMDIKDTEKQTAVKIIKELSNSTSDSTTSWYTKLNNIVENKILALKNIGVIPNYISDNIANKIVKLYDRIYENKIINFKINEKSKTNKLIVATLNKNTDTIDFNEKYLYSNDFSLENLGATITHESLHVLMDMELNTNRLHEKLIPTIITLKDSVDTLNISDFNTKYKSDLNDIEFEALNKVLILLSKEPREIVTNIFTNKQFANIASRIQIESNITIENNKSFWSKIIDTLLEILGIETINDNTVLGQLRNIVVNSLDSIDRNRGKKPKSVRQTQLPTGERPKGAEIEVTPDLTKIISNSTHGNIENIKNQIIDNDLNNDKINDFLNGDTIDFEFNADIISVTAGREVGLTYTPKSIKNISKILLENQEKIVSLQGEYVTEFIDKYIDDNNTKIC